MPPWPTAAHSKGPIGNRSNAELRNTVRSSRRTRSQGKLCVAASHRTDSVDRAQNTNRSPTRALIGSKNRSRIKKRGSRVAPRTAKREYRRQVQAHDDQSSVWLVLNRILRQEYYRDGRFGASRTPEASRNRQICSSRNRRYSSAQDVSRRTGQRSAKASDWTTATTRSRKPAPWATARRAMRLATRRSANPGARPVP